MRENSEAEAAQLLIAGRMFSTPSCAYSSPASAPPPPPDPPPPTPPSPPSSSPPLSWLSLQGTAGVKLATLPYHVQLCFLEDIHQHLNLGVVTEEEIIVHPEHVFGGDLRDGQVPTSKPTLQAERG